MGDTYMARQGLDPSHATDLLGLQFTTTKECEIDASKDILPFEFGASTPSHASSPPFNFNVNVAGGDDYWNHLQKRFPRVVPESAQFLDNPHSPKFLIPPAGLLREYADSGYESQSLGSCQSHAELGRGGIFTESTSRANLMNNVTRARTWPLSAADQFKCSICDWVGSNQSQKKKHEARHQKPHKCEEGECIAAFSTKNDLERHRKAVHCKSPRCGTSVSYKCFGKDCGYSGKVWPRLDNFKAHLKRKHREESEDDLLLQSQTWYANRKREAAESESAVDFPVLGQESPRDTTSSNASNENGTITPSKTLLNPDSYFDPSTAFSPVKNDHIFEESCPASNLQAPVDPLDNIPASPNKIDEPASNQPNKQLPNCYSFLHIPTSENPEFSPSKIKRRSTTPEQDTPEKSQNQAPLSSSSSTATENKTTQMDEVDELESITGIELRELHSKLSDVRKRMFRSRVSQILSEFVREDSMDCEPMTPPPAQEEQIGSPKQEAFTCSVSKCNKTFNRLSVLRKHERRHEKLYGCTFTDCDRAFGSKADWKRHETMQHYHSQFFRCPLSLSHGEHAECAALYHQERDFIKHLNEFHGYEESKVSELVSKSCIGVCGPKSQFHYWCGFCEEIKVTEKTGLDAINERFDHIDFEHFKKGANIKQWDHAMEGGARKEKKLEKSEEEDDISARPSKRRSIAMDQNDVFLTSSYLDNSRNDEDMNIFNKDSSSAECTNTEDEVRSSDQNKKNKTQGLNECKKETLIFCCKCGGGPQLLGPICCQCSQMFCPNCFYEQIYSS